MERGNQIMERSNQVMERSNEVIVENRRAFEDLRTFLRELTMRQERVAQATIEQIEGQIQESRELRREFVEESRAQRAALFQILDRLDNGGAAAGA